MEVDSLFHAVVGGSGIGESANNRVCGREAESMAVDYELDPVDQIFDDVEFADCWSKKRELAGLFKGSLLEQKLDSQRKLTFNLRTNKHLQHANDQKYRSELHCCPKTLLIALV